MGVEKQEGVRRAQRIRTNVRNPQPSEIIANIPIPTNVGNPRTIEQERGRTFELNDLYNKDYTFYSDVINRKYAFDVYELAVFYKLCLYSYDKRYVSVALSTLEKELPVSRRKIVEVLKDLQKKKAIRKLNLTEARKLDEQHPEWKRGKGWGKEQNVFEILAFVEFLEDEVSAPGPS